MYQAYYRSEGYFEFTWSPRRGTCSSLPGCSDLIASLAPWSPSGDISLNRTSFVIPPLDLLISPRLYTFPSNWTIRIYRSASLVWRRFFLIHSQVDISPIIDHTFQDKKSCRFLYLHSLNFLKLRALGCSRKSRSPGLQAIPQILCACRL